MSEVIWVMESEICDTCGALLGYFGEYPECGDDDIDWDDCDREEEYYEDIEFYSRLAFLQECYDEEKEESSPNGREGDKVEG